MGQGQVIKRSNNTEDVKNSAKISCTHYGYYQELSITSFRMHTPAAEDALCTHNHTLIRGTNKNEELQITSLIIHTPTNITKAATDLIYFSTQEFNCTLLKLC